MDEPLHCSDPQAERRWIYGRSLFADGDFHGARDLFEQCLERAPGFAPAWGDLGQACEKLGERSGAEIAYRRAAALDPLDRLGADARLRRLLGDPAPPLASAYVKRLFDDYAARFDRHLVGSLQYTGPEIVVETLDHAAPRRSFARALDLGCGTGLAGAVLRGRCQLLEGIDLSPNMVEQARRRGVYDALAAADAVNWLRAADAGAYDLVVAADVLVYIGDLAPVFTAVSAALALDGLFVFTVESMFREGDFALADSMRYRHAERYLRSAARSSRFDVVVLRARSTRTDSGEPVPGYAVALRRLGA